MKCTDAGRRWFLRPLSLRSILAVVAILALLLTIVVQEQRAAKRESQLRRELFIARSAPDAHKRMREVLSDLGIVILREASSAQVFRILRPGQAGTDGSVAQSMAGGYPIAFTGKIFGNEYVSRFSNEITEYQNYIINNNFDLPDPRFSSSKNGPSIHYDTSSYGNSLSVNVASLTPKFLSAT